MNCNLIIEKPMKFHSFYSKKIFLRKGTYWVFSIIITACYTSSIIAFVTLPVFPDTVDTVNDLLNGYYRVGTFGKQTQWKIR